MKQQKKASTGRSKVQLSNGKTQMWGCVAFLCWVTVREWTQRHTEAQLCSCTIKLLNAGRLSLPDHPVSFNESLSGHIQLFSFCNSTGSSDAVQYWACWWRLQASCESHFCPSVEFFSLYIIYQSALLLNSWNVFYLDSFSWHCYWNLRINWTDTWAVICCLVSIFTSWGSLNAVLMPYSSYLEFQTILCYRSPGYHVEVSLST